MFRPYFQRCIKLFPNDLSFITRYHALGKLSNVVQWNKYIFSFVRSKFIDFVLHSSCFAHEHRIAYSTEPGDNVTYYKFIRMASKSLFNHLIANVMFYLHLFGINQCVDMRHGGGKLNYATAIQPQIRKVSIQPNVKSESERKPMLLLRFLIIFRNFGS